MNLLVLNTGSFSIKFALFRNPSHKLISGKIDRIGLSTPTLTINKEPQPTHNKSIINNNTHQINIKN